MSFGGNLTRSAVPPGASTGSRAAESLIISMKTLLMITEWRRPAQCRMAPRRGREAVEPAVGAAGDSAYQGGGCVRFGGCSVRRAAGLRRAVPAGAGRDRPPGPHARPAGRAGTAGRVPPCGGAERWRLEDIARLVGHSGTAVTEAVYRKQIRPVLLGGAEAMDRIFT
ncbi:hypothetical protein GCM10017559_69140 [Streptosporangium longisporum]|uniref:Tyr recombinase domain-containing protein n=1 Tax=Streptosporangium longisporum TaxID=46187 RepID=A0ABP6L5R0_9ACTN